MSNRTKLGLNILEAALLLGVLGDALLRQTPWGVNVFLWTGAFVIAIYALHARWGRVSFRADGGWLLLPIGFFAAAFAWRDSATLNLLDGLALFAAFALLAWRGRGRNIRLASLSDYALGLGHAAFAALFASLPLVINDVQWATIPRGGAMRHLWAVARGVVIAVPLLFIFGALFMAADAVFEGIMRQTFQLDVGVLSSHFVLMLLFTWLVGGFLRGMMLTEEAAREFSEAAPAVAGAAYTSITVDDKRRTVMGKDATRESVPGEHRQPPGSVVVEGGATEGGMGEGETDECSVGECRVGEGGARAGGDGRDSIGSDEARPLGVHGPRVQTGDAAGAATMTGSAARGFSLGAVEVGIVLGLLDVLFACFVIVQFRYFFGGAARVMSITELTYAEYARRGFFELTWVAGLVLPLLLITHAMLRRTDHGAAAERIFRALAGTQIALLFVIMASAVARMRLYQSEYGLTELRLYTTAFMLWLGLVFVWFTWTVLVRNARERFACGALVAAFLTAGLLHLLNPDAYIVRANTAHARAGRAFDATYAASLSADAVPALISAMPSLSRDERCLVARELSARWSGPAPEEDWRTWNLARSRARRAVAAHQEDLSEATCTPPANIVTAPTTTPDAPETAATTTNTSSPDATTTFTHAGTATGTDADATSAPLATTPVAATNGTTTTGTTGNATTNATTSTNGNGTTNATSRTTSSTTSNTTSSATSNTTNSAATMSMITGVKGATTKGATTKGAMANASKRVRPAPRGGNRKAGQLERARSVKRAKAR